MYAEQILGIADCHAVRKAHNTKVGFLDGKVKCNKNNILLKFSCTSQNERKSLIPFATRNAHKMKALLHQCAKLQDQILISSSQSVR